MKKPLAKICCTMALSLLLQGPAKTWAQAEAEVGTITVTAEKDKGLRLKKEEINRVESLQKKDLDYKQAQTFSQLIDDEKGIDSQTACAFCGAKRITINGLKGEHTTILVDGLPLHSTISGFYGVDAIPLESIDSIDIHRGAGAALTAPESIGGALNILTKDIGGNEVVGSIRWADQNEKNVSLLGTYKLTDKFGILLGVQTGEILPLDLDKNRISEAPEQKTQSVVGKLQFQVTPSTEVSLRLSHATLKNWGGTMMQNDLNGPVSETADYDQFPDGDVRNRFLGDENQITDNVDVTRTEAAFISQTELDDSASLKLAFGSAWQAQRALYTHGYDYANQDQIIVGSAEYQKILNSDHLLSLGLDTKSQTMTSESEQLYNVSGLEKDNLHHKTLGLYLQDTWFINQNDEVSLVARFDRIKTEWTDLNRVLEEDVFAPRLYYKHIHNEVLTSRVGAGIGYRAPLTLFESQHGTDHFGFILDIDRLETAKSFTYSLAGQRLDDFFEFGSHFTYLENMAYGVDQADSQNPTIFRNSDDAYLISVFDVSYGRRITPAWTVEGLFETFYYPAGYKEKLPVAAIEKRFSVTSNYHWQKWTALQKLTIVGERDLSAYGYGSHYNKASRNDDIFDPDNFGQVTMSDQKFQKAPTYFTLDLSLQRSFKENYQFAVSVLNVFDYTQTSAGDSPTTWDLHGSHFHLDNFHIWGPLRGRQIFLSLSSQY